MRILILTLFTTGLLTLWAGELVGQQLSQSSLFALNPYQYNPAYAGMDESLSMTGTYRNQWVGLEGAPETSQLNAHLPFYYVSGALGVSFENENIGAHQQTSFSFSYSQWVAVGREGVLAIGLGGGWRQRVLDGTRLRAPDGSYEEGQTFIHNDQLLPQAKVTGNAPHLNAGIYLKLPRFEVGLAAHNLSEAQLDYGFSELSDFRFRRHYVASMRAEFLLGEDFSLRPAVLFQSDVIEHQLQANVVMQYSETIFGGAGIRGFSAETFDALVFIAGLRLNKNFSFAYSFDLPMSALQQVTDGSHEIMLRFNLNKPIGKGKLPKIIYNPRFL
jgi:type IX secretion system PorP/SprF family membrane protein